MRKSISVTFFSMVATLLVLGTAVLLDGITQRIEEELGASAVYPGMKAFNVKQD